MQAWWREEEGFANFELTKKLQCLIFKINQWSKDHFEKFEAQRALLMNDIDSVDKKDIDIGFNIKRRVVWIRWSSRTC